MGLFRLPGSRPVKSFKPQLSTQRRPSQPGVLSPDMLEHGAYYAGRIASARVVARWHAKRQRFVLGEFTFGRERGRSSISTNAGQGSGLRRFTNPFRKSLPASATTRSKRRPDLRTSSARPQGQRLP